MRISSIPYFYKDSSKDAIDQAYLATQISHNHQESYNAATSVVNTIWLIINNKTNITEIKDRIEFVYGDLPPIQKIQFNETCQETIPICYSILLNSSSFEDAMRKSIYVGGDTDTICAIVGSMAEPLFGIPKEIEDKMWNYLDNDMKEIIRKFEQVTNLNDF